MTRHVVDLLEMSAEEPLVRVTGPLGQPAELAGTEWTDLAIDVEAHAVPRWLREPIADYAVQHAREATVLAYAHPETERLRQLAGLDLSRYAGHPQGGKPAEQQHRGRTDDCGPALLDVRVGQVEPHALDARVGVRHRGEAQRLIRFHAHVGPSAGL